MVSTREHPKMGLIPVSRSGLESAYLECVADPSISRPNGAMPTSEGCNPGKVRKRGCVLKERRIRIDLTGSGISSICDVPSERVDVSGVVPKVAPWAGMRRPVGAREPYRFPSLRCNGASSKSKAAETAALQIGRRRQCVCLKIHGLRNHKWYHYDFWRVQVVCNYKTMEREFRASMLVSLEERLVEDGQRSRIEGLHTAVFNTAR
jgi:hypothetical protein